MFIVASVAEGEWDVVKTAHHKCGRCWRHLPEVTEDGELCDRCDGVIAQTADAAE
jgi:isoleucyl-tRNA synthetase